MYILYYRKPGQLLFRKRKLLSQRNHNNRLYLELANGTHEEIAQVDRTDFKYGKSFIDFIEQNKARAEAEKLKKEQEEIANANVSRVQE